MLRKDVCNPVLPNFDYNIALVGNPNVGKSTIFNTLTGLKQHTGNWTGKTVECSSGTYTLDNQIYKITDLPGTYSLVSFSEEEEVARDFILNNKFDCLIIVIDSTVIERNLSLALQILSVNNKAVLCLNLCDEAERNGVYIDTDELSLNLGIPVIKTCATKKKGILELKNIVSDICNNKKKCFRVNRLFEDIDITKIENYEFISNLLSQRCNDICQKCVSYKKGSILNINTQKIDKIVTSKVFGIPIMLTLFALLFWITAIGANYPSRVLSCFFEIIKLYLYNFFELLKAPDIISGFFIDGIYTTLTWVISVMLPPMAIFFPLFSIIEDLGYLPRIAFNLDKFFSKFGAHGKQSLTMAMGIGCNACGITGCRIIESKQDRLIAIITNNFMPCNGRFPTLIAIIMMFFAGSSFGVVSSFKVAFILLFIIIMCVAITMIISKLLSISVLKNEKSSFALELPPYRKPQILKTIVRSFLDRTLFVLGRAVIVAIPAGALIWLSANIYIGESTILNYCTDFFEPFGKMIGLDGVIVMAFILGFPANETVIPIIIMSYLSNGTLTEFTSYEQLLQIFTDNGWTIITAVCMIIMCIMHFPCSTTCLTIKKETGSVKWTLASILIPSLCGIILCFITSNLMRLIC